MFKYLVVASSPPNGWALWLWESTAVPFVAALVGAGVGAWVSWIFHTREVNLHREQLNDQRSHLKAQQEQSLREAIVDLFEVIYDVSNNSQPNGDLEKATLTRSLERANVRLLAVVANAPDDVYELFDEQINIVRTQLDRRARDRFLRPAAIAYYNALSEELKKRDVMSLGRRLKELHDEMPPPNVVRS